MNIDISLSSGLKIKWRVGEKPKGLMRVTDKRPWPTAEYPDGDACAFIECESGESYHPESIRLGSHGFLKVKIKDYNRPREGCKWSWSTLKRRFTSLDDAKASLIPFFTQFPESVKPEYVHFFQKSKVEIIEPKEVEPEQKVAPKRLKRSLPKVKWVVDKPPTGRFRSFEKRGWPTAEYPDGSTCAALYAEDGGEYSPSRVKEGNHAPLLMKVFRQSESPVKVFVTKKNDSKPYKKLKMHYLL